jgi:hypothetical protein
MPSNRNVSVDVEHAAVGDVVFCVYVGKQVAGDDVERRVSDAEVAGVDCPGPGKGGSVEEDATGDRVAIAVSERGAAGVTRLRGAGGTPAARKDR